MHDVSLNGLDKYLSTQKPTLYLVAGRMPLLRTPLLTRGTLSGTPDGVNRLTIPRFQRQLATTANANGDPAPSPSNADGYCRFSIGQFFGSVGLQGMSNTHPGEYLIPLYTQICSPSGDFQVIAGSWSVPPRRIDDRHLQLPPRNSRSAHRLKTKNLPNRQHGAPRLDDMSEVARCWRDCTKASQTMMWIISTNSGQGGGT